jgi:hypothetical protein
MSLLLTVVLLCGRAPVYSSPDTSITLPFAAADGSRAVASTAASAVAFMLGASGQPSHAQACSKGRTACFPAELLLLLPLSGAVIGATTC